MFNFMPIKWNNYLLETDFWDQKGETGRSDISVCIKVVNPRINNFPKLKYQFWKDMWFILLYREELHYHSIIPFRKYILKEENVVNIVYKTRHGLKISH